MSTGHDDLIRQVSKQIAPFCLNKRNLLCINLLPCNFILWVVSVVKNLYFISFHIIRPYCLFVFRANRLSRKNASLLYQYTVLHIHIKDTLNFVLATLFTISLSRNLALYLSFHAGKARALVLCTKQYTSALPHTWVTYFRKRLCTLSNSILQLMGCVD